MNPHDYIPQQNLDVEGSCAGLNVCVCLPPSLGVLHNHFHICSQFVVQKSQGAAGIAQFLLPTKMAVAMMARIPGRNYCFAITFS